MDVLPNGDVELHLDARKESSGPGAQPLSPTPMLPTSGYTTGSSTGGAPNTGTAPIPGSTSGFSTTPGFSTSPRIRNAGTTALQWHKKIPDKMTITIIIIDNNNMIKLKIGSCRKNYILIFASSYSYNNNRIEHDKFYTAPR